MCWVSPLPVLHIEGMRLRGVALAQKHLVFLAAISGLMEFAQQHLQASHHPFQQREVLVTVETRHPVGLAVVDRPFL